MDAPMIDLEPDGGVPTNPGPPSLPPGEVLLDWELTQSAQAVTVALWGELDMTTAPRLRAVLTEILTPGRTVVVDTAGLRFCSAGGLQVLAEASHRAHTCRAQLRVVIPPGSHLARVWIITGLASVLPPDADRDAAGRERAAAPLRALRVNPAPEAPGSPRSTPRVPD
jgi:anti-anti-sigma factor